MDELEYEIIGDSGVKYVEVTVSNKLNYITNYNLQNTQITMRCGYNIRSKSRWVILYDSQGDILLPQTFLRHKKRCELNFNSNLNNLNYYLTLKLKDNSKVLPNDYDYANWADDFDLCFVGYEFDMVRRMKRNFRIIRVGN